MVRSITENMSKQTVENLTEALLKPILDKKDFELVDVEYVKEGQDWFLRCFIDKEGGISINDCEAVSRELETELDEQDFVPGAYILEVSSPGLTRALKKDRDFDRNIGKPVEVHTYKPIEGVKEFIGDLTGYSPSEVILDIGPDSPEEIRIPRSNISVIRQYFVF